MIYILDNIKKELVEAEIIPLTGDLIPKKKDEWLFDWSKITNSGGQIFGLRTKKSPDNIEGAILLKIEFDMLIMDLLEIAPHNLGKNKKRYDYVAGCLIAYACRESFKITGDYQGFVTFVAKTDLIKLYKEKYGAEIASGQRMFIDINAGHKLIKEYLEREKT